MLNRLISCTTSTGASVTITAIRQVLILQHGKQNVKQTRLLLHRVYGRQCNHDCHTPSPHPTTQENRMLNRLISCTTSTGASVTITAIRQVLILQHGKQNVKQTRLLLHRVYGHQCNHDCHTPSPHPTTQENRMLNRLISCTASTGASVTMTAIRQVLILQHGKTEC